MILCLLVAVVGWGDTREPILKERIDGIETAVTIGFQEINKTFDNDYEKMRALTSKYEELEARIDKLEKRMEPKHRYGMSLTGGNVRTENAGPVTVDPCSGPHDCFEGRK